MPIYEYQCAECEKVFEAFQKINDDPLTECRFCKGKVERLVSKTSFQLKGDGWYVTDYAKRSESSKTDTNDAPKSDGAEKSSESKSDSAPKSSESGSGDSGGKGLTP